MSKGTKYKIAWGTIAAALAILIGLAQLVGPAASRGATGEVREIVLEARDLAFNGDNPVLRLQPGERVRVVVRNSDTGILHSITLPGIDSEVRHVKWGEEISFELTVPEAGAFEYVCPQHLPKMKGRIEIAAKGGAS